jgi:type III secretion protein Q
MPEQPSSGILTSGDDARVMRPAVTASDIAADDLPDMPRWLMPMHRRWGRPRLPVDFATAYGTARLVPVSPIRLQAWTGNWATVRFALSDRELSVSCPIDVVLGLSARRFPELPFANLDRELAAAVVDHLLGDMLTLAERVFAPGLRVMRIDLPAMPPELGGRLFDVALEDHMQFPLHVAGAGQDMEVLERIVADWPVARQNLSSIKVPISLRAGFARLTLDGLAALEVGSGIILDRTFLTFQKIAIVTGERFVQTSTYQNMRPVLDGPLLRIPDPATTEYTMGAAMNEILEDESSAPFGSVRDVPVHLVFELGRTSLTVGELEAVGQGHVFELSKPLNEAVEILSGGRRIGTGSLVRIGDAIGVRVSRIAT